MKNVKLTVEDIAALLESANVLNRIFPAPMGGDNPSPLGLKDKVAALGKDDLYAFSRAIGTVRKVGNTVGKIQINISS